eukprot:Sspe_Gene.119776::Locus_116616_Transcript_1_1_Confidence_1.000_Length_872::g.119776::m.119776
MGPLGFFLRRYILPTDTAKVAEKKTHFTQILFGCLVVGVAAVSSLAISDSASPLVSLSIVAVTISFCVGLLYMYTTQRYPPVEFISTFATLCVLVMDLGLATVVDSTRCWSLVVVVMDARLFLGANSRLTSLLVWITLLHLLVCSAENTLQLGLFDALTPKDRRLMYVTCDDPPCSKSTGLAAREYVMFSAVFILDFKATRYFAHATQQERRRVEAAVETAERVAQALAHFDLERALAANESDLLPKGLVHAFHTLVGNLATYKPYLPDSCL